ncbi:hypothetical protein [Metabacillus litoralis]|uniref:hypothetical protein n=1 Tax=Metabacillus litoralis TaxID=152268 RepID=UPI00203FEDB7|nr:hypothetical protein [Metabacillus litoralis]
MKTNAREKFRRNGLHTRDERRPMQVRKSEEMVFMQEMKTNARAKIRRNGLRTRDEDQCKCENQKKWSSYRDEDQSKVKI